MYIHFIIIDIHFIFYVKWCTGSDGGGVLHSVCERYPCGLVTLCTCVLYEPCACRADSGRRGGVCYFHSADSFVMTISLTMFDWMLGGCGIMLMSSDLFYSVCHDGCYM